MVLVPLQVGKTLYAVVDGSNVSLDRKESLNRESMKGEDGT